MWGKELYELTPATPRKDAVCADTLTEAIEKDWNSNANDVALS
jgi:hypothetical protein